MSNQSEAKETSVVSRAVRGATWVIADSWIVQILSFFHLVLLTRLIAPEAFGLFGMGMVLIALADLASSQGIAAAVIQRRDLSHVDVSTAFWLSTVLGLAIAMLVVMGRFAAAKLMGEPEVASVLLALVPVVWVNALGAVPEALLRRDLEFRALASINVGSTLVSGVVGIVAGIAGLGVYALVIQAVSMAVARLFGLVRASRFTLNSRMSGGSAVSLLRFGTPVIGSSLVSVIARRVPDAIVGSVAGPAALGHYMIARRALDAALKLVVGPAAAVSMPALSRLQQSRKAIQGAYLTAVRVLSAGSAPVFFVGAAIAPGVVPLVLGAEWAEAGGLLQVLLIAGLIQAIFSLNSATFAAVGRPSIYLGLMIVSMIGDLLAFGVFIQDGVLTAVAAYAIRCYLTAPLAVWMLRRVVGVRASDLLRASAPVVLLASVTFVLPTLVRAWDGGTFWLSLGIVPFGALVLYLLLIWQFDRPTRDALLRLFGMLASDVRQRWAG